MKRDSSTFLRYAFRADAVFCALSGVEAIVFSERLATFLGIADPRTLTVLGAGLLAWAAHLVIASRRPVVSLREAWYFVTGGLLWIAGSVALIVAGPFTFGANVVVGVVAAVVLAFTEAQYLGIRRVRTEPHPTPLRQAA